MPAQNQEAAETIAAQALAAIEQRVAEIVEDSDGLVLLCPESARSRRGSVIAPIPHDLGGGQGVIELELTEHTFDPHYPDRAIDTFADEISEALRAKIGDGPAIIAFGIYGDGEPHPDAPKDFADAAVLNDDDNIGVRCWEDRQSMGFSGGLKLQTQIGAHRLPPELAPRMRRGSRRRSNRPGRSLPLYLPMRQLVGPVEQFVGAVDAYVEEAPESPVSEDWNVLRRQTQILQMLAGIDGQVVTSQLTLAIGQIIRALHAVGATPDAMPAEQLAAIGIGPADQGQVVSALSDLTSGLARLDIDDGPADADDPVVETERAIQSLPKAFRDAVVAGGGREAGEAAATAAGAAAKRALSGTLTHVYLKAVAWAIAALPHIT